MKQKLLRSCVINSVVNGSGLNYLIHPQLFFAVRKFTVNAHAEKTEESTIPENEKNENKEKNKTELTALGKIGSSLMGMGGKQETKTSFLKGDTKEMGKEEKSKKKEKIGDRLKAFVLGFGVASVIGIYLLYYHTTEAFRSLLVAVKDVAGRQHVIERRITEIEKNNLA
eukprot:Platyproteum_vivax@DN1683_c0_g1_i1.p1